MPSQCPKCHQVLDEDYVCCAGLEFQWKCQTCHKRSRGFALPFGACPSCGGTLMADTGAEALKTDAGLALLHEALQIEISGICFYRHLAGTAAEPSVVEFFSSLAAMEEEHAQDLIAKYHLHVALEELLPSTTPPLPQSLFEGLSFYAKSGDVKHLYDTALILEHKARDYFRTKTASIASPHFRDLCQELASEEEEHIHLLESERDKLLG